ncbi:unnamed protein product, partial [Scytosiphon promiscuus]
EEEEEVIVRSGGKKAKQGKGGGVTVEPSSTGSGSKRKSRVVSESESSSDGDDDGGGGSSSSSSEDSEDSEDDFSLEPSTSKKKGTKAAAAASATATKAETRSARNKPKGKGKGKGKRRGGRVSVVAIDLSSEDKDGGEGAEIAAVEETPTGKKKERAKKEKKGKGGASTEKVDGGAVDAQGGGEDGLVPAPTGVTPRRSGRTRRKSSMINYREMLDGGVASSSDEESKGLVGGSVEEGGASGGSGWEGDDGQEEDEQSDEEFEGKGEAKRCGKDEDADEDDGFAETLRDDDEEEEEEEESDAEVGGRGKKSKASKAATGSGSKRKGRRQNRYDESDEEDDEDDGVVDDDDEGDEGDAFFSHAAFFHEMEQTQDGGVHSLSVGTMSFKEAFHFYIEYIAKATQDEGAGKAFMKKYVANPRLPEHARYGKAKEMVEKKLRISGESMCGTWRQEFRDTIMRYPHYGYHHVTGDECGLSDRCSACNRSNRTKVVAFLSGSEYDPSRVWDGLRWDKHLPEHWDDPNAMAISKQKSKATHYLGDTCKHKSHLFHSLTHYKLYLVSKVAAKVRGNDGLEPENFRGEGGGKGSKKRNKRGLRFSECEFESLSALLDKANDLNGVKWGGRVGVQGGHGKTFLQMGAASSILDWLSGEAQPGQF